MATTTTFSPVSTTLAAQVGVPFTQTFTWTVTSDIPEVHSYDIGLIKSAGEALNSGYLTGGSQAGPFGVTLNAPTGNPTLDNTITISGTPTVNGTYYVYVRGRWVNDNLGPNYHNVVQTYTINVTGGSALATNPIAGSTISPTAVQNTSYVSNQFTIQNGGGPYTVTLSGNVPAGIGLSTTPSFPGTVNSVLSSIPGTAFYLVGTPSVATAGSLITIQVQDLGSGQTYAGANYNIIVNNSAGGTMSISEVSRVGWPTNTPNCVQSHPFNVTFSAGSSGTLPYTWSTSGGSLPNGLSISTVNNQGVISGTPTGSVALGTFSFNVVVNDNAFHSATQPYTLTVTPGATYTGGPLPATGSVGAAYGPTTLTVVGGAGGTNRWRVKVRYPNLTEAPGVFPGMTVSAGSVSGAWYVVPNGSMTIGGTPNTAVDAGSYIVVQPMADDGAGGFVTGDEVAFPVTITGTNTLTISPGPTGLGAWIQNQSRTVAVSVNPGTAPYNWAATTGLPSGINATFNTTASGTFSGGYSGYGSFPVTVGVSDTFSAHGGQTFTLTVTPDIWTTDTLPSVVRGGSYSHSLVFHGGDGTGFTYVIDQATVPAGLVIQQTGTGNNTLSFTSSNISAAAGTYNIGIRITVPTVNIGGSYTKSFSIPFVITGSSAVNLVARAINTHSNTLCVKDSVPVGSPTLPKIRISAIVTGGATNTFTITAPGGWSSESGSGPWRLM